MTRIRTVAVLPTMFTLANLVCGFFAIVVASRIDAPVSVEVQSAAEIHTSRAVPQLDRDDPAHNMMVCGWLIFLAMVFDALDGHVARLAKTSSDFGAQLDSLCDVVSFGVAPAILLVKMCPTFSFLHREAIWIIAASFAACAALRLARFSIETGENENHMHFSGLPSPAAAASIAGFAILFYTLRKENNQMPYAADLDSWIQNILPAYAVLIGVLMVSRIPYPHIVNQTLRGQHSFGHVVTLVFAFVAVMVIQGYSVAVLCCAFVVGPPVRYFWLRFVRREVQQEPLF